MDLYQKEEGSLMKTCFLEPGELELVAEAVAVVMLTSENVGTAREPEWLVSALKPLTLIPTKLPNGTQSMNIVSIDQPTSVQYTTILQMSGYKIFG